jgi:hypothetical protein
VSIAQDIERVKIDDIDTPAVTKRFPINSHQEGNATRDTTAQNELIGTPMRECAVELQ